MGGGRPATPPPNGRPPGPPVVLWWSCGFSSCCCTVAQLLCCCCCCCCRCVPAPPPVVLWPVAYIEFHWFQLSFLIIFMDFYWNLLIYTSFLIAALLQCCCIAAMLLHWSCSAMAGCSLLRFHPFCYAMLVSLRNNSCLPASRISIVFYWVV